MMDNLNDHGEPMESFVSRHLSGPGWSCQLRQVYRYQNPTTEPNPLWTFTDKAGHTHRYEKRPDGTLTTPTLITKTITRVDEYEGDTWDYEALVCLECGEEIEPGRKPVPQPMLKWSFDGTYQGILGAFELVPSPGMEIEVGSLVPGMSGKATVAEVQVMRSAVGRGEYRLSFDGSGELVGFDNVK
jgi:hypothetical protein